MLCLRVVKLEHNTFRVFWYGTQKDRPLNAIAREIGESEEDKLVQALGMGAPEGRSNVLYSRSGAFPCPELAPACPPPYRNVALAFRCSRAQSSHQLILLRIAIPTNSSMTRSYKHNTDVRK